MSFLSRRAINWRCCTIAQRELARLMRDEPRFDLELRAFLGRTYDLKAIADYETDPGSAVTVGQAQQAIATAERFDAWVEAVLA